MVSIPIYHGCMVVADLDIDILRCFVEVAQSGSFTQAGNNIGLTQSGVSVKIRRLEERLSTKVFNRTSKRLSLTHEGELLMGYAVRILSLHDEALSRLTRPKASGRLRVGLIDYFIPDILPNLLNRFRKNYPNIHLEVQTATGINLVLLYQKGELDLVVTGKDTYQGSSRVIYQEPLVWVVGKDTELACNSESVHLVSLPSPCSFRKIAVEGLEKADRKWEILFTGSSIANIQAAVQAGIGISVLPLGALKDGIKRAPSHLGLPELPIYSIVLVYDDQKANNARDLFISYLEAELHHLE